MAFDHTKTPFPWFGGKTKASPIAWQLLGDPAHYVEPFAGSLAVLLNRPHAPNRAYYSETVNDLDGFVVNAWRSIALHPDEVARHCSWPVAEADIAARHLALVRWRENNGLSRLYADPDWCDPKMAGWWLYGICAWIGSGWCSGTGAWTEVDGLFVKQGRVPRDPGIANQRPHLSNDGMGVHAPQLREATDAMVMPKLAEWMRSLSGRLRHVRIVNGDWRRVCKDGALNCPESRSGKGHVGLFLDPPYAHDVRSGDLYAEDARGLADDVCDWCLSVYEDRPWLRIVVAGFDTEHTALEDAGWSVHEWYKAGFLSGGMGNTAGSGKTQAKRDRLWASPSCAGVNASQLFE